MKKQTSKKGSVIYTYSSKNAFQKLMENLFLAKLKMSHCQSDSNAVELKRKK